MDERNAKIVTLCGSTKFKDEFIDCEYRLALKGFCVLSVSLFGHVDHPEIFTPSIKNMLDDVHKQKIRMSDMIFVINKDGYIGQSTRDEILYAIDHAKAVAFMEDLSDEVREEFNDLTNGRFRDHEVVISRW